MPTFVKQTSPMPAPKAKQKKKHKSSIKKPAALRKRPLGSESIYGEELFSENIKREKEIVIGFYPFTENNLRISKCGKFIIERLSFDEATSCWHWNLFYYSVAITDFDHKIHKTYDIKQDQCILFPDFHSVESLADKVIKLVRLEFLADREKKLEELREQDALEKFARDLAEAEAEKEQENELDEGNSTEHKSNVDSENNNSESASNEASQIPTEAKQENVDSTNSVTETGNATGMFVEENK